MESSWFITRLLRCDQQPPETRAPSHESTSVTNYRGSHEARRSCEASPLLTFAWTRRNRSPVTPQSLGILGHWTKSGLLFHWAVQQHAPVNRARSRLLRRCAPARVPVEQAQSRSGPLNQFAEFLA